MVRMLLIASTIFGMCAPSILAQIRDEFSIHVESNLILIHAEVFDEQLDRGASTYYRECSSANANMFYKLLPSEPFLPKDCFSDVVIHGLTINDFHVFEDEIEQRIESVKVEWQAHTTARDNFGAHSEWSYAPSGKWSSVDTKDVWGPGPTHYSYRVAYIPLKPEKGKCYKIRVTVNRPHTVVYASDQYCYTTHPDTDPVEGTEFGNRLKTDLISDKRGKIPVSLQAGFFYTASQKARIVIALGFPWNHLDHEWTEGELRGTEGVLGSIEKRDETLAARFSDIACCVAGSPEFIRSGFLYDPDMAVYTAELLRDYDPHVLPTRYETQVELPAGEYSLRVVLSDGKKFGRVVVPLVVDNYDGTQLALSSVILSKRFRDARAAAQEDAAVNLAPRYVRLVSKGMQVSPAPDTRFKRGEKLIAYFEVYEPLLKAQPATAVQVHMRIVDAKTGEKKVDFPPLDAAPYEQPGDIVIPIGNELIVNQLKKGDYRLEVQASDSAGKITSWRTVNFTLD